LVFIPEEAVDEDIAGKKKPLMHEIGQDLSELSLGELQERINNLKEEIARLEQEIASKGATRDAADKLFR
jgi:uncharacterized small protein (DUF1192 family)